MFFYHNQRVTSKLPGRCSLAPRTGTSHPRGRSSSATGVSTIFSDHVEKGLFLERCAGVTARGLTNTSGGHFGKGSGDSSIVPVHDQFDDGGRTERLGLAIQDPMVPGLPAKQVLCVMGCAPGCHMGAIMYPIRGSRDVQSASTY